MSQLDEELHAPLPANNKSVGLARKALVGRVLTSKVLNRNAIRDIIYKAWNSYEGLHISEKGSNMFLFSFKEEAHDKDVMLKAPWYVMNHLIC